MNNKVIIIGGIDPGPDKSGFIRVLFDKGEDDLSVHKALILGYGHIPNKELLSSVEFDHCDHMVVEGIACYGKPVGNDTIYTAYSIGEFKDRWVTSGKDLSHFGIFLTPEVRTGLLGKSQGYKATDVRAKVVELWHPILPDKLKHPSQNTHVLMALSLITYYIQNVYGKEFFKA